MTEEVTRAIATKFLDGIEDFELIKEENYKNYVVYFAAYKKANGNTNYGLPIYVLIDVKPDSLHLKKGMKFGIVMTLNWKTARTRTWSI